MKLFRACITIIVVMIFSQSFAQDLVTAEDKYDFPMSWNKVFHIPLDAGGNPFWLSYSTGEVRVEGGAVVFDDASCGKAEKRVWRPLGHFLGDVWTARAKFTPTQGYTTSDKRTSAIVIALTAGTKDANNDLVEPVDANSTEASDQDGIFVLLNSANSPTSDIWFDLWVKDGTTRLKSSVDGNGTVTVSYGNTYYLELLRTSATQAQLKVFTDANYSTGTQIGNTLTLTIPATVQGLGVVQHGTLPGGGYTRHLTATLDDFELLENNGACIECGESTTTYTTTKNRIIVETATVPVQTPIEFEALSNGADRIEQIQYLDGLGRAEQSILINGTVDGKDVVGFQVYNDFGRITDQYLPYAEAQTQGGFQTTPITDQGDFYNSTNFPGIPTLDLGEPLAISQFESSPLSRLVEQGAPGVDWQPELTTSSFGVQNSGEHTSVMEYDGNLNTDQIFAFPIDISISPVATYTVVHSSNALYVTKQIDENGYASKIFTDKKGQPICIEKSISAHLRVRTYILYDSKGRPIYVLQPEGEEAFKSSDYGGQFKWTQELVDDYCFQYKYDLRGRLIEKKVPGADWIYMVYDRADKLVATQDGNQRSTSPSTWLITKYDALGRVIITGSYEPSSSLSRSSLQSIVDGSGTSYEYFETRANMFVTDKSLQSVHGYTDVSFPALSDVIVHSVIYHDSYDYNQNGTDDVTYKPDATHFSSNEVDLRVRGKVTGVRERILNPDPGMPIWLWTSTFYDSRGREIQTISDNHLNGADTADYAYSFVGEVLASRTNHVADDAVSGTYTKSLTTWNFFTYDHSGRLMHVEQRTSDPLNSGKETPTEVIVRNEYNTAGQLLQKKLHQDLDDEDFWQSVDYSYNIRGWLSRINQFDLSGAGSSGDLFSMSLSYNEFGTNKQYNGNVAFIQWQVSPDDYPLFSAYDLKYDGLNRLLEADYFECIDLIGSGYTHNVGNFDVSISYDDNGNIESLQRNSRGNQTNSATNDWEKTYASFSLDDLSYDYTSSGNQLQFVEDAATTNQTSAFTQFLDGNTSGNDYDYDPNGNITEDLNKGITLIEYNHMNKPVLVQYSDYKKITYVYSASGRKLRQRVYHPEGSNEPPSSYSLEKQSDYVNAVHYEDSDGEGSASDLQLVFAMHIEGRLRPNGNEIIYEYVLKDHLGNTRVTFSDLDENGDAEILQENHYYPFGMEMTYPGSGVASPPNLYQYNGKEIQDELGLGWLDYGARMYDASIARWNGVDPLAELLAINSPYSYVSNNPLNLIDPTGMFGVDPKNTKGRTVDYVNGDSFTYYGNKGTGNNQKKNIGQGGIPGLIFSDNSSSISSPWTNEANGLNPNSNRDEGSGSAFSPNINSESRTNRTNNHDDEYFTYLSPRELFERYFDGMNKAATDINLFLDIDLGQKTSSDLGPYPAVKIYDLLDNSNMLSSFENYSYGGIMASFIRVEIIQDSDEEILFDSPLYNKGAFIPIPDPYIALPSDFTGTFFDGTTGFNITDAFPSRSRGGPSPFPYKDFLLKDGQQISVRISIYVQQIIPH